MGEGVAVGAAENIRAFSTEERGGKPSLGTA